MNGFLIYLLEASAGIVLFYSVYWFFLRNETFFTLNRWYLQASLILSALIPVFPLHYKVLIEQPILKPSVTIQEMTAQNPIFQASKPSVIESGPDWMQILFIIYLAGLSFVLVRLVFQSAMLLKTTFYSPSEFRNGIRIVENHKYAVPFSFFNTIFINPEYHKHSDLAEILAHEEVHILGRHWLDLIVVELLTIVFWFNPFIWLFERSVKQNHEYLADAGVLSRGHTVGRYQAMLVNQMLGVQVFGLANNLNYALYPNRLKMMTKMKTPRIKFLKMFIVIPAFAVLIAAFARPEYTVKAENSQTPITQKQKKEVRFEIKGKVLRKSDGKPMPGASIILKGTTWGTIPDIDGNFIITDGSTDILEKLKEGEIAIVVSFVGYKTQEIKVGESGKITSPEVEIKLEEEWIGIDMVDDTPPKKPLIVNKKEAKIQNSPAITAEKKSETGETEQIVFFVVEEMPQFPGGSVALENLMKVKRSTFMESELFKSSNLSGKKVFIGFTVGTDGSVINPVLTSPNIAGYTTPEMSETVKQKIFNMVTEMPKWSPGKQRGKPVPVNYIIPIVF